MTKSEQNNKNFKKKLNRSKHFNNSDNEKTDKDKTMTILQLGSASMLRVNLTVASIEIVAVIETGAEVTIISDKIYESMQINHLFRCTLS